MHLGLTSYCYELFAVAGVTAGDGLDLEVESKVGAGLLPGVGVVPAEHLAITDVQVLEHRWLYWILYRGNERNEVVKKRETLVYCLSLSALK